MPCESIIRNNWTSRKQRFTPARRPIISDNGHLAGHYPFTHQWFLSPLSVGGCVSRNRVASTFQPSQCRAIHTPCNLQEWRPALPALLHYVLQTSPPKPTHTHLTHTAPHTPTPHLHAVKQTHSGIIQYTCSHSH